MFTVGEIILIVGTTALILWLVTVQAIYVKALAAEHDLSRHGEGEERHSGGEDTSGASEPPAEPS